MTIISNPLDRINTDYPVDIGTPDKWSKEPHNWGVDSKAIREQAIKDCIVWLVMNAPDYTKESLAEMMATDLLGK
jgi:hypothetical protein